jgi:hypothetical protein
MRQHTFIGKVPDSDVHILSFSDGEFKDIPFSFDTVSFDTSSDSLVVKFEYTIWDESTVLTELSKKVFETELGDFIMEVLKYGAKEGSLGIIRPRDAIAEHIGDQIDNRTNYTFKLNPQ